MLLSLSIALVDLIFPYITRHTMNTLLPEKMFTTFFLVMGILFACYLLRAWFQYLVTIIGHRMGTLVEADMRRDVFQHMQSLSFSFFDRNRTGVLMAHVTNDLFEIVELAHHGPENLLICGVTLVGALIILLTINVKLTLVLLVLLPVCVVFSATVETTEFDATISALEAMIDSYGGWVESSSVNGAKYSSISRGSKTNRSASYTVRVPNGKFNSMMSDLSSLGNIPYSHVYTENVTSQYYDTQARLQTYQAQEKRLMELLDKAETVSDVIEIENELTEVRYRIESLQTSLRGWDRRVSWSTLYLTINEVSLRHPSGGVSKAWLSSGYSGERQPFRY